ncbi:ATP-dependent DNA helicase 2 subunit ku80-like protein [Trifolium pratense]|uniref:ATP-dependent DNA helicase 2 subunit ku80-like protein n=1 Tax=Trifolium pratense TaxID=57577 RepID=A0A2K3PE00_TRIPR|nr:ATP-dependent DNA helicase 2 subunit ku80-like protein [Trifolium pratense]
MSHLFCVYFFSDTDNELTTEVGGYQHVVVMKNSKVVDGDIVEALQQLPRGTSDGDCIHKVIQPHKSLLLHSGYLDFDLVLDAVIVAMDMLIKKFGETNKGKKRLCLITNAQCPIKDPYEGSKEEQVTTIAKQMTAHVTVFKGDLELGPKLRIKVLVYKKTQEEKFPTLKKYSDKAPQTDKFATHEVKVDYEYKSAEDPDKVVPPDQRIKGYRYGPQIVPISSAEWDAVKFKPEKGVKLLGFTDSSNILRHQYMKDVYVFIAEPGNTKAVLAVSALSRAMKEMNKVAILRCAWRQGQSNVVIGVLTPNVSDRENIPDSFYFNILPFAEDVREFQFPSFSSFPALCQPNKQQLESAANFIKMLDLAPDGKKEVLLPDFTPNPRFYHYLDLKSKHPDASVPPLDYTLRKITEPETNLILQKESVVDSFRRSFELQGNPLKKPRRLLRDKTSDEAGKENITAPPANLIEYKSVKVENIGDLTPVQDFEAMISRRDSPDWVLKAIKDMKNKIFGMVEDSHEGDNYPKALECLIALRKGCILEQEPKQFNDFLKHLYNFCQEKNLQSFCEYLASKGLTLIPKTEAIDSDVTDEEARSFLVKSESKSD